MSGAVHYMKFDRKSQVDALIESVTNNESVFWQSFIGVLINMPSDCCCAHARKIRTKEAVDAIKFGQIRYNDDSGKNLNKVADVTPELLGALKVAVSIAGDNAFLFCAKLTGSNRASGKDVEVSRQSAHNVISRSRQAVEQATLNSGSQVNGVFGMRTLLWYDGSKASAVVMLESLIKIHGGNLSWKFLESVARELKAISK